MRVHLDRDGFLDSDAVETEGAFVVTAVTRIEPDVNGGLAQRDSR